MKKLKAPFPWFGGKSRVAHLVWERFGNTPNYVEPFAGSLAVLLGRPFQAKTETVNDKDCYLANFWRALQSDAAGVAANADWPINEADLHARHRWLHNQVKFRERMEQDPEYFDVRIAGWWVWGLSAWIGDNWCSVNANNSFPKLKGAAGVHCAEMKRPAIGGRGDRPNYGGGIHQKQLRGDGSGQDHRRPHLTHQNGVHSKKLREVGGGQHRKLPKISHANMGGASSHESARRTMPRATGLQGAPSASIGLGGFFDALSERLRYVRVCCGDWSRVVKPSVCEHNGLTAVFLDPPYGVEDRDKCYNHDSLTVSADVRKWAIENGDNKRLRIALCGYEGEHEMPESWDCVAWKAVGGYANQNDDRDNDNCQRERIWFSPHCLKPAESLF